MGSRFCNWLLEVVSFKGGSCKYWVEERQSFLPCGDTVVRLEVSLIIDAEVWSYWEV